MIPTDIKLISNEKLLQAKTKLMLENPYLGTLVTSIELRVNNNIASCRPLGDVLEYNDEYLEVLSVREVATVLANSAMHQALFHSERGKDKVSSVWNLASDYAINDLLVQNGFMLPPMANHASRFEMLYAEQIYTILLGELDLRDNDATPQDEKQSDKPNEEAEEQDIPEELLAQEEYELLLEQLNIKLEKHGDLPKGIERFVDLKSEAKVSWRDELYRYVNTHAKSDYRMFPSAKKHLYRGFALPSIYGEELKIIVAIDTSASIDDELLKLFLAELYEIMQVFTHYVIELIECDASIQNIQRLTPQEPLEPTFKGGGGTNFTPVFDYVMDLNEDFKFLIYFTDGKGAFPNYEPLIDVLWVMPKHEEMMPFGEVLMLEHSVEKEI
jgi:predicted metal-dependent peptidase